MTPRQAVDLGATNLVVGRPIYTAADPRAAAEAIAREAGVNDPMSPVEAKICGLSTPETVDAAVRFGARFVGFVTFPKSPRHISTETMRALGALVPKTVDAGRPVRRSRRCAARREARDRRARPAAAPWRRDARAGRGDPAAHRQAGHEGDQGRRGRPTSSGASRPMPASPIA